MKIISETAHNYTVVVRSGQLIIVSKFRSMFQRRKVCLYRTLFYIQGTLSLEGYSKPMHPVYGSVDCIIYGWFPTIDLISDDQLILQFSVILTMNEELNLPNYKR